VLKCLVGKGSITPHTSTHGAPGHSSQCAIAAVIFLPTVGPSLDWSVGAFFLQANLDEFGFP
jgi:hypothetical protein